MYVERRSVKDLPEGAIILNDEEVTKFYENHIFGTANAKEIWGLKYGFCISGFTSFLTNFWLVNYYRKRCKIHGIGPAAVMNLGFVALPAAFALFFHYSECRSRILLHNICTSCLYGRAAIYQNMFSIFYGLGPSAMGCMVFAAIRNTYPIPGFAGIQEVKDSFKIWQKFTKRIAPGICLALVANTAIITYITYNELESKVRLDEILQRQHEELKKVAAHYQQT